MSSSRRLTFILLAGSVLPLGLALAVQFGLGWAPCHFCLLQRYPYVLVFICGVTLFFARTPQARSALFAVALLGWLATAALGAVHTGIEQGWIAYHGGCVTDTGPAKDLDELRKQVIAAPSVSCADVAGKFLGLSLATWNTVTALAWIALALHVRRRYD